MRSFAELTTLRTGGPAARFVEAATTEALIATVAAADTAGVPVLVLGGGSNLVVANAGFDGVTVAVRSRGVDVDGDHVTVAAGEPWDGFVAAMVTEGRGQLAALSGIPGTAGATPIQNVGAYGVTVAQFLEAVTVYDRRSGVVRQIAAAECGFGNRTSIFKRNGRYVVLAVRFILPPAAEVPAEYAQLATALGVEVGERVAAGRVREAVLALRRSKGMVLDDVDHDTWSVGSFFVNPVVAQVPSAAAGCPTYLDTAGTKLSAAWLIEQAGFGRGYGEKFGRGRVRLSTKHTLAITNRGEATTSEVVAFAAHIRDGVTTRFGVTLDAECDLVGCTLSAAELEDVSG